MSSEKKVVSVLLILILIFGYVVAEECKECEEVAKGMIPAEYLEKSFKVHPSGVAIWDNEEAFAAFKDREGKYLWVDTRPQTFYTLGTIKNAVLLVCDQEGKDIPAPDNQFELTQDKLMEAMAQVDQDIAKVKVIYFCQGPKCHRSYNAALRSVDNYGIDPTQIVWFRDGYPNFLSAIEADPKLKKRITRYLQGDVVSE